MSTLLTLIRTQTHLDHKKTTCWEQAKKPPSFISLGKKKKKKNPPKQPKNSFQLWLIYHCPVILSTFMQLAIHCLSHHGRTSTEILYLLLLWQYYAPFWMTTELNSNNEFGLANSYIAEMFAKKKMETSCLLTIKERTGSAKTERLCKKLWS